MSLFRITIIVALAWCLQGTALGAWQVRANRTTGETIEGNCITLNDDVVEIQTESQGLVSWPRSELVSMAVGPQNDRVALPAPITPFESRITNESSRLLIFPNDDRLVFVNCQPTETSLDVEVDDDVIAISVPWEAIAYWMQSPRPSSASLISGTPARTDRLLLSNGDLISGELTAFTPEGLRIATAAGEIAIGVERIAAVSLNPDLTSLPSLPESWVVLLLADGSRLTATHLELGDERINVRLLIGSDVSIPVTRVLGLYCYGENITSLTTLSARRWEYKAYLPDAILPVEDADNASSQPIVAQGSLLQRANPGWNRSTLGGPLLLGNVEIARGIGMRPRSALTFRIDGDFSQFQAMVGIDDRAGREGSVAFRVESANEVLWTSPVVTGGTPPLDTGLIDVAGREELTLVVDFAEWGDVQDLAVWGNPILIRSQSTE